MSHVFDLVILPGDKDQFAPLVAPSDITGTINNLRIGFVQRILYEAFRRFLRIVVIAQRHGGSPDTDFSRLTVGCRFILVI